MPGTPRFLAENFYNAAIRFSDHTVRANEEVTGHEAVHVGDGRRGQNSYWTPTTNNSEAWIEVECDRPRSADCLVIDRGHNLDGETVVLEASDDNFSTTEEVLNVTVPSVSSPNQRLSDGARNTEGAYMHSFDARIATYWRLRIPAMGGGLKPQIRGLWVGNSWQPTLHMGTPFGWGEMERGSNRVTSDAGWVGETNARQVRRRAWPIKLASFSEYAVARYHTEGLYWRGDPMWIWPDPEQAEKGWLGKVPQGRHEWRQGEDRWAFMQTDLEAREHQPESRT